MSALLALRRLLSRGKGVSVALTGEAGVGKSFTLEQFLHTLPCRIIRVNADWALARVIGVIPSHAREPEWISAVCRRVQNGEIDRGGSGGGSVVAALTARLEGIAPVVLVVDHLHRATAEQLDFWEALGAEIRNARSAGLVVLSRKEAPRGFSVQEVHPLDREGLKALLNVLQAPLPESFVTWMQERTDGNPLLALELIRHLERIEALQVEAGLLYFSPLKADSLPTSLVALVRSLLPSPLAPETERALIRALLTVNSAGLGEWAAGPAREALEQAGLLSGNRLRPLYREALLLALPPTSVVSALQDLVQQGEITDPLLAVKVLDDFTHLPSIDPGIMYALLSRAAETAEKADRRAQAAELWERAASNAPPGSAQRAQAWWAASLLLGQLGEGSVVQARELALRALKEAPGQLELSLNDWCSLLNRQAKAGGSLAEIQPYWPACYASKLTEHWLYCFLRLDVQNQDAQKVLHAWEALTPQQRQSAPANIVNDVGRALLMQGRLPEAKQLFLQCMEEFTDPVDRLSVKVSLLRTETLPSPKDSVSKHDQILLEAGQIQSPEYAFKMWQLTSAVRFNRTVWLGALSRYQESIPELAALGQEFLEHGDLYRYVVVLNNSGTQLVYMGRFEEARQVLEKADLTARKLAINARIYVKYSLVVLYFSWNTPQSAPQLAHAVAELSQLLELVPPVSHLPARIGLAMGLAACGRVDIALPMVSTLEELARANDSNDLLHELMLVRAVCASEQAQGCEAVQWQQQAVKFAQEFNSEQWVAVNAMWAAHFANDTQGLEHWGAVLTKLQRHGTVHTILGRRHEAPEVQALPQLLVLGDVQVYQSDGQPFKAREGLRLLTLLLCARLTGADGLSTPELLGELFPERDELNAVRALRRLVAKIRGALGEGVIRQSGERFLLGDLQSDAELFLESQEPSLWRGLFLNGDWHNEFTDATQGLLLTHLEGMTQALLDSDPSEAERLAALLYRAEPYEVRLLALLLRAHDAAGHPRQAGAAYRRARETLSEVGEDLPESWQAFLAAQAEVGAAPALVALSGGPASGTVSAARQARALKVHRSTILRWQKGEVQRPGQRGRAPQLSDEALEEVRAVMTGPPSAHGVQAEKWTLAVIADYVLGRYDVRLSRSQLSRLLRQER